MSILKIFLILCVNIIFLNANILVNNNTTKIDLLSKSEIFLDKTKTLSFEEVKNKKFESNTKSILSYGYNPNFDLWLKFSLSNKTNKKKIFIIEYDNCLTTSVQFFDPDNNYKMKQEGLFFIRDNRKTVNPYFLIELKPNETKTYFMNVNSEITTLIVGLKLWDIHKFYEKEVSHQFMLALFFGAMFVLLIYNLFIFFFTKDISYFYYVLYIFAIVFHQLVFVGIGNIYFYEKEFLFDIFNYAPLVVVLPIFTLALFTKSFLKLEQYPIHNKILNILILLVPINVLILLNIEELAKYRNHITIIILTYLMYVTIYALFKKNKQAKYIFIGWVIFFFSGSLMIMASIGYFNIYKYIPYFAEVSIVTEAIILSIALSNRIKILQEENDSINKTLILQKENEKERLEKQVFEKTKNLNYALEERELLLKELNHRVKNNMQTIVSLIRLQNDEIKNEKLNDILITIQNRISAMSYLHELLYTQNDMTFVNTSHYFKLICEEIQCSYNKEIIIDLDIKAQLRIEQAMYCGLILNELITNTFKYAYPKQKKGKVFISLEKNNGVYKLIVADEGVGFESKSNSLGLIIVENLAKRQLKGEIETYSSNGVKNIIEWKAGNEN
ncbi:7TM diverse intracellular signaling domain-containing protein [Halarcobacter mediterraneus]|uniref:7TM diverse intracellular signaling domain-containing protein n=1 Tax=Halarcobacter mediterraneus TaxID=2023153 RepID=UPI0019D6F781|nr:7TM diverse intracellular signaling domain-containing protein [Halarcobacter mediterraneus]